MHLFNLPITTIDILKRNKGETLKSQKTAFITLLWRNFTSCFIDIGCHNISRNSFTENLGNMACDFFMMWQIT